MIKPVVLMQHGLADSGYAWLSNFPEQNPAFVALRAGYDVWLGNSRGNSFSRKHVQWNLDMDSEAYWNFDWQEMGQYDLPAVFDYIAEVTGEEKIAYIGHSQGTT